MNYQYNSIIQRVKYFCGQGEVQGRRIVDKNVTDRLEELVKKYEMTTDKVEKITLEKEMEQLLDTYLILNEF